MKFLCEYCNKDLDLPMWRIKQSKHHFCSIDCKGKWQKSDKNDYKIKIQKTISNLYINSSFAIYNNKKKITGNNICTCLNCNKQFKVWKSQVPYQFCNNDCKYQYIKKFGLRSQENNNNWKGGVTKINFFIRSSEENKKWKILVFQRDNFSCRITGDKTNIQVHHIFPLSYLIMLFKINKNNWKEFSDILFDIDNGITLTKEEHKKIKGKEFEYIDLLSKIIKKV